MFKNDFCMPTFSFHFILHLQYYYEHGFPKSDLFEFIEECQDGPNSPLYMSDDQEARSSSILSHFDCFRRIFERLVSIHGL